MLKEGGHSEGTFRCGVLVSGDKHRPPKGLSSCLHTQSFPTPMKGEVWGLRIWEEYLRLKSLRFDNGLLLRKLNNIDFRWARGLALRFFEIEKILFYGFYFTESCFGIFDAKYATIKIQLGNYRILCFI